MGVEAVESSACEVIRRKDIIPAPTYQPFGPDIIRMKEVEDTDQELSRQAVERVTCIGDQALDKSLFASSERADQAGETAKRSALLYHPDMPQILRCIALAQWEVKIGVHQCVSHGVGAQ